MNRPEQALQIAVADALRLVVPSHVIWTAFPAGGGGAVRGGILRAMGLRAGVFDLMFITRMVGDGPLKVLFIELKAPKGRMSEAQMNFRSDCLRLGISVAECRSVGEVLGALTDWGLALRGKVSA